MDWSGVMFLSDSHSDGTHSLQSIHYWDTFLQTWWRNKLILILDGLRVSTFPADLHAFYKRLAHLHQQTEAKTSLSAVCVLVSGANVQKRDC